MPTDVLTYHDLVTLEAELMPWAACVGNEPLPVHPKEMLLAVQELMQHRRADNTTHLAVLALERRLSAMERLLGMD